MGTSQRGVPGADTIRVSDIMVAPVRTVAPDLTVPGLTRLLLTDQITGAPVVSAEGRLLGVVSSSDILRALLGDEEVPAGDTFQDPEPARSDGAVEDPQELLLGYFQSPGPTGPLLSLAGRSGTGLMELTVADIMTPAAFTISPDATLGELAGFLSRGRIHRLLVVDRGTLLGIVTSSDVVRLCAGEPMEGSEP